MQDVHEIDWGDPKCWYSVPGSEAHAFEKVMRKVLPDLFEAQPDLLFQLVTMLNPSVLQENGVNVYKLVQEPGNFVITFPRAFHAGFNCGLNCAEAVNFAPADWLPHGGIGAELYRLYHKTAVLSHEELVYVAAKVIKGHNAYFSQLAKDWLTVALSIHSSPFSEAAAERALSEAEQFLWSGHEVDPGYAEDAKTLRDETVAALASDPHTTLPSPDAVEVPASVSVVWPFASAALVTSPCSAADVPFPAAVSRQPFAPSPPLTAPSSSLFAPSPFAPSPSSNAAAVQHRRRRCVPSSTAAAVVVPSAAAVQHRRRRCVLSAAVPTFFSAAAAATATTTVAATAATTVAATAAAAAPAAAAAAGVNHSCGVALAPSVIDSLPPPDRRQLPPHCRPRSSPAARLLLSIAIASPLPPPLHFRRSPLHFRRSPLSSAACSFGAARRCSSAAVLSLPPQLSVRRPLAVHPPPARCPPACCRHLLQLSSTCRRLPLFSLLLANDLSSSPHTPVLSSAPYAVVLVTSPAFFPSFFLVSYGVISPLFIGIRFLPCFPSEIILAL
ncbi:putative lysine-specific demethylase [Nymphaea thermarum]|nr:putative lysine-specific demethylase [Nymphaea thermarum]